MQGLNTTAINGLKKEGYTLDFNIEKDCIVCRKTYTVLSRDEFEIDKVFRFEGVSNPDDEAIVYAISSQNYNARGTLVNGYGIYADDATTALIEKLQIHH